MDYYYILQSIPIFDISDKFVSLPPPLSFIWDLNIQLSDSAIGNYYKILFTLLDYILSVNHVASITNGNPCTLLDQNVCS